MSSDLFRDFSFAEDLDDLHARLMAAAQARVHVTPAPASATENSGAAADSTELPEPEVGSAAGGSAEPLGPRLCVYLLTTITAAAGEPGVVPHPRARSPTAADVTAARRAFYTARLGDEAWMRRRAAVLGRVAALEE